MSLIKLIDFHEFADTRGALVALEGGKEIPFEIRRVYYLYNLSNSFHRGFHAHRTLEQVAVCISGSCSFLLDDGLNRQTLNLASPAQGLCIEPMVWHEMFDFSSDCVLMVIASEHYDESDYIRDYEQFVKEAANA
ncbi:FdtA/QdtA family cupin domain-containing protein [Pseudomonas sp.]|uniref:sugar 3,4-ketoisomerase n=1 Tax=Pseudomonas sp. TaxID=306 RepID=UPI00356AAA9E